jgi:hypothetical protein
MGEPAKGGTSSGVRPALHVSVAALCSNLVTRPTGRAVRAAIEREIARTPGICLSVLDFSRVGVLDFSCADEVIAKLLDRYRRADRPVEAFFVVRGVSEHHREPIEAVLRRHGLLLVTLGPGGAALWGRAPGRLRSAWDWLGRLGRAFGDEFAAAHGVSVRTANAWLNRLAARRVAVPEGDGRFASLPALLEDGSGYGAPTLVDARPMQAADGVAGCGGESAEGGPPDRVQLPI